MNVTEADRVWNRAALEGGGMTAREGDRALAALLVAHGLVMNGGVEQAMEALSADELEAAAAGFRFFSFGEVASLLEESSINGVLDEEKVEEADDRYAEVIPDDSTLVDRFSDVFRVSPDLFAPFEPA